MKGKTDFLIVGQGIAGTLAAWFLEQAGKSFVIIDQPNSSSSSVIAGAILNPVTGKRMVKSWRVEEFIPFAVNTYREMEQTFDVQLIEEKPINRYFLNPEDQLFYRDKMLHENAEQEYFSDLPKTDPYLNTERGGVAINSSYHIDSSQIIESARTYYQDKESYVAEPFVYDFLELDETGVSYKGYQAERVIFCEGARATQNPWFDWLPYNLAKGEMLHIKCPELPQTEIRKVGVFLLPLGDDLFYVGSTNDWKYKDEEPTATKKQELVTKLNRWLKLPYEIVNHKAAIRPTVRDRRPLIGIHPAHSQLVSFNGMGTKGYSLGPYFANELMQHLINNQPLDKEVDIRRFAGEVFRT